MAKQGRADLQRLADQHDMQQPNYLRDELAVANSEISRMNEEMGRMLNEFLLGPFAILVSTSPGQPGETDLTQLQSQFSEDITLLRDRIEEVVKAVQLELDGIDNILNDHGLRVGRLEVNVQEDTKREQTQNPDEFVEDFSVVARPGKRRRTIQESFSSYTPKMQHMESSIPDFVEKLRSDFDDLRESIQKDKSSEKSSPDAQRIQKMMEPRFEHLEKKIELNAADITILGNVTDSATEELKLMRDNFNRLESLNDSTGSFQDRIKDVESVRKNLDQIIQQGQLRAQEFHIEKQERLRLQESYDAIVKRIESKDSELIRLSKVISQVSQDLAMLLSITAINFQLEIKIQQQEIGTTNLTNQIDVLLREADPKLDAFLKQTEERILSEFLPDIITRILKQQEENVVQRLIPRLDPMLRLVEQIYSLTTPGHGKPEANHLRIGNDAI
jgi:hypothetical protein